MLHSVQLNVKIVIAVFSAFFKLLRGFIEFNALNLEICINFIVVCPRERPIFGLDFSHNFRPRGLLLHYLEQSVEFSFVVVPLQRYLVLFFEVFASYGHSLHFVPHEIVICNLQSLFVEVALHGDMAQFHEHIVEHNLAHEAIGRDLQCMDLLATVAFSIDELLVLIKELLAEVLPGQVHKQLIKPFNFYVACGSLIN